MSRSESSRDPRVLLVEDDGALRDAYGLALRARGLHVETAASVTGAMKSLEVPGEHPAGTVVADLGLPDGSGAEVVRRLRDVAPEVALLVLTGEDSETLRTECERAGADAYLVKPVSGSELAARIRREAAARRG